MRTDGSVPSSFRDPSGSLFLRKGVLYRRVNHVYKDHYQRLMQSGLYQELTRAELLIPHSEVDLPDDDSDTAFKMIRPEPVPFISYPYEWSFSQLKDAALATLKIQKLALNFGMSLKDASAYNIQFKNCMPILIDTLSFENYCEGRPWIAYRQFCQHFLAPLALMSWRDIRLNQLLRIHIDGIPLDLASSLLPFRSLMRFSLLSHIHLHAKSQKRYAGASVNLSAVPKVSKLGMLAIIDSLESAVKKLTWAPKGTEWADYYQETNYSSEAFQQKKQILSDFLEKANPANLWDFGANTGTFSRVAGNKGIPTIAWDCDAAAVEKNYLECIGNRETNILPLLLDLTNPSPAIGWDNSERMSLFERGPADAVCALALIHHLAISNNVPLEKIAFFFSRLGRWLIVEFVPKSDSQVQRLLLSREDIFPKYTQQHFEIEFNRHFEILDCRGLPGSERSLYLMRKRQNSPANVPARASYPEGRESTET